MSTERRLGRSAWRSRELGLAALLLGLCLTAPTVCAAQDESAAEGEDAARAERLFREGVALLGEARYASARAVLADALALDPRASTAFNLASALHALGESAEASDLLARIESGSLGPLPSGFDDALEQLRTELSAALGELEVTLESPPRAQLQIDDGEPADLSAGEPLVRRLSPGEHRLDASADGFETDEHTVRIRAGQRLPLVLALSPSAVAAASLAVSPEAPAPGPDVGLIVALTSIAVAVAVAIGVIIAVALQPEPAMLRCDPVVGCIET